MYVGAQQASHCAATSEGFRVRERASVRRVTPLGNSHGDRSESRPAGMYQRDRDGPPDAGVSGGAERRRSALFVGFHIVKETKASEGDFESMSVERSPGHALLLGLGCFCLFYYMKSKKSRERGVYRRTAGVASCRDTRWTYGARGCLREASHPVGELAWRLERVEAYVRSLGYLDPGNFLRRSAH